MARVPLKGRRLIPVTSHRRESWGPELEDICLALRDLASRFDDLTVVYPVHLNPNVRRPVYRLLSGVRGVHLLPPLDYLAFHPIGSRENACWLLKEIWHIPL